METGPEAKARLLLETATKGELGLKLCERHYFAHIEGSSECVFQTAQQFNDFLDKFPEKIDDELDNLDNLVTELEEIVGGVGNDNELPLHQSR